MTTVITNQTIPTASFFFKHEVVSIWLSVWSSYTYFSTIMYWNICFQCAIHFRLLETATPEHNDDGRPAANTTYELLAITAHSGGHYITYMLLNGLFYTYNAARWQAVGKKAELCPESNSSHHLQVAIYRKI